mmetsp:Transcript_31100/g.82767  ORF Transcript_31100/g.82767 Transcript_31100/m.82767 type:complete len:215 (+) Transcript_31100:420-1064(+)
MPRPRPINEIARRCACCRTCLFGHVQRSCDERVLGCFCSCADPVRTSQRSCCETVERCSRSQRHCSRNVERCFCSCSNMFGTSERSCGKNVERGSCSQRHSSRNVEGCSSSCAVRVSTHSRTCCEDVERCACSQRSCCRIPEGCRCSCADVVRNAGFSQHVASEVSGIFLHPGATSCHTRCITRRRRPFSEPEIERVDVASVRRPHRFHSTCHR